VIACGILSTCTFNLMAPSSQVTNFFESSTVYLLNWLSLITVGGRLRIHFADLLSLFQVKRLGKVNDRLGQVSVSIYMPLKFP
jgi:hypothetical protein